MHYEFNLVSLDSLTPPGQSLAFYDHVVLLPSLGWHTSWWLRSFAFKFWSCCGFWDWSLPTRLVGSSISCWFWPSLYL